VAILVEGYGAGTQEAALTVTVTTIGAHTNVAAALGGANFSMMEIMFPQTQNRVRVV